MIRIKKYNSIFDIFDEHYEARLNLYDTRKKHDLDNLQKSINLNEIKMKFIKLVINDEIIIYKNKKENIVNKLVEHDFPKMDKSYNYILNLRN